MDLNDNLKKNITEATYLSVENTKRYRPIIRYFFEETENMNYFLYKEDVFNKFVGLEDFEDYTIEKAESDLSSLVNWKCLTPIQDIEQVYTLESFKNKKYRYQLSKYTLEIERLIYNLENLHIEGSSLEPTLVERIKEELLKANKIVNKNHQEVFSWWTSLYVDFRRVNDKYKDYIRSFYNIQLDEISKSDQFILRKNDLVNYLRSFIKILQDNSYKIEHAIMSITPETQEKIIDMVVKAQRENISLDKIDEVFDEDLIRRKNLEKFKNLKNWFVSSEFRDSELQKINDKTSEIIRKITRVASQIAENNGNASSRKDEYKHICEMFCQVDDIEEAHKLSSTVFGLMDTRHISGNFEYNNEIINSNMIDLNPFEIIIKPRIRDYKMKIEKVAIVDKSKHKEEIMKEYLRKREEELMEFNSIIKNSEINLASLDIISSRLRKNILNIISKANQSENKIVKTEDGKEIELVIVNDNSKIVIKSVDGNLTIPNMKLLVK